MDKYKKASKKDFLRRSRGKISLIQDQAKTVRILTFFWMVKLSLPLDSANDNSDKV